MFFGDSISVFYDLRLRVDIDIWDTYFIFVLEQQIPELGPSAELPRKKMVKNSLNELDEILAKSQRLNSSFTDAASAARHLNRGVCLLPLVPQLYQILIKLCFRFMSLVKLLVTWLSVLVRILLPLLQVILVHILLFMTISTLCLPLG